MKCFLLNNSSAAQKEKEHPTVYSCSENIIDLCIIEALEGSMKRQGSKRGQETQQSGVQLSHPEEGGAFL
jgi:hypothetical protein